MRTLKLILLGLIMLGIIVLAVANRETVTLRLLPQGMSELAPGAQVRLPLFVLGLLSVATGLVLGYLLEYLREAKHRRRAAVKTREATRLNREVEGLRRETNKPKDEVLALIGS